MGKCRIVMYIIKYGWRVKEIKDKRRIEVEE